VHLCLSEVDAINSINLNRSASLGTTSASSNSAAQRPSSLMPP